MAVDPGKNCGFIVGHQKIGVSQGSWGPFRVEECAVGVAAWDSLGTEDAYFELAKLLVRRFLGFGLTTEFGGWGAALGYVLILEDFILMPSAHGGGRGAGEYQGVQGPSASRDAVSPIRVTSHLLAVLQGSAEWRGGLVEVVRQQPSFAKRAVDNERLRALGLWQRGATTHQRDAARHLATWGKRNGIYEIEWIS
jgi:hypothetical protein